MPWLSADTLALHALVLRRQPILAAHTPDLLEQMAEAPRQGFGEDERDELST
jgi:hypothetical protein